MAGERTEAYWRDLVRRFNRRGPGVTLVDFCLEHRVSSAQLYMYRKRFREEPEEAPASLVPVQVVDVGTDGGKSGDGAVEVAVGGNVLLRFQVGSDARYMAELVAGVGRRLGC